MMCVCVCVCVHTLAYVKLTMILRREMNGGDCIIRKRLTAHRFVNMVKKKKKKKKKRSVTWTPGCKINIFYSFSKTLKISLSSHYKNVLLSA